MEQKPENLNWRGKRVLANTRAPPDRGPRLKPKPKTCRIPIGEPVHLARSEGKATVWTTLEKKLDWTSSGCCSAATEDLVELFGASTTRVCVEQHLSTSDQRRHEKCYFTRKNSANLLPSKFDQVLQNGQVPDDVWTDKCDQEGPPAEGPGEQVPRKRIRVKSKTAGTAAHMEPSEDVFTAQEEESHE